jgi:hypothetical protein
MAAYSNFKSSSGKISLWTCLFQRSPVCPKILSSLPVFEKREFFNADEFIKGTGLMA